MNKFLKILVSVCFLAGLFTSYLLSPGHGRHAASANGTGEAPKAGTRATRMAARQSPSLARLETWLRAPHKPGLDDGTDADELPHLVWSLPASNYSAAWLMSQQVPEQDLRLEFQEELLHYWARIDPRATIEAVAASEGRGGLRGAVQDVLKVWARNQPAAALAWVEQVEPTNRLALALVH
jgi:hypothetical protein